MKGAMAMSERPLRIGQAVSVRVDVPTSCRVKRRSCSGFSPQRTTAVERALGRLMHRIAAGQLASMIMIAMIDSLANEHR
jgi:hypothetical protein